MTWDLQFERRAQRDAKHLRDAGLKSRAEGVLDLLAQDPFHRVNEVVVEPGADHAFFNDTGKRYSAAAADDAWQRLQNWFARHLI